MSRNPMPEGRWQQAMRRAGYQCEASRYQFGSIKPCNGTLNVHHRRPKGTGGTSDPNIHDLSNLAVLCVLHHSEVHSHPARSYECGLLIRR